MPRKSEKRKKVLIQAGFDDRELSGIDAYRRKQPNPPTRAEAVRQLCVLATCGERPTYEGAAA
jgi:hypothetical protein